MPKNSEEALNEDNSTKTLDFIIKIYIIITLKLL